MLFMKDMSLSIEMGMSKEMPPSESNMTTTSPSSLDANSVSLTFEEKAQ
jgi:hypothetical protein